MEVTDMDKTTGKVLVRKLARSETSQKCSPNWPHI
jgi:hypothetical protein